MSTIRPKESKFFPAFKEGLPRADGKVFVITGTTSGTGYIAARTVLEKGGTVVCLNRTSQRVIDSAAKLQEETNTSDKIVNVECDLQDFASVRKAAVTVKAKYNSIYCLACNAGISNKENKATKDGCDVMMQTNHLSHFILAKELLPLLEQHASSVNGDDFAPRIVTHSSEARNMVQHKRLERKYLEKKGGDPELGDNGKGFIIMGGRMHRYSQTKLANSVMMHSLHNKLQAKESKVLSVCCHPGASTTNMANELNNLDFLDGILMRYLMLPFVFQSAEDGTMGLLFAMMHPDAKSGELYGPVGKGNMAGPAVLTKARSHEIDEEAMNMLWEASEETTGVKFSV